MSIYTITYRCRSPNFSWRRLPPSALNFAQAHLTRPVNEVTFLSKIVSRVEMSNCCSTSEPHNGVAVQPKQQLRAAITINGDLNNVAAMRKATAPKRDPNFAYQSLALSAAGDDPVVQARYRPFLLSEETQQTDWISVLELATVTKMVYHDLQETGSRLKVLVLYGSLRKRYGVLESTNHCR
jgi:hypothetical protein